MNEVHLRFKKILHKVFDAAQSFQQTHETTCSLVAAYIKQAEVFEIYQNSLDNKNNCGVFSALPQTIATVAAQYVKNLEKILKRIETEQASAYQEAVSQIIQAEKEGLSYYATNVKNLTPWFEKDEKHAKLLSEFLQHLQDFVVMYTKELQLKLRFMKSLHYDKWVPSSSASAPEDAEGGIAASSNAAVDALRVKYDKFIEYTFVDLQKVCAVVEKADREVEMDKQQTYLISNTVKR